MSGMRAGRPFVAASQEADARLAERLDRLVDTVRSAGGGPVIALVLAGSLARGEGVVFASSEGQRLLSDIDLYVVMDPVGTERGEALAAEIRRALEGDSFLLAPLDVGVVDVDFFGRERATLPAHQARHGARVLWETGRPWTSPTRVRGVAEVDPDDARKLLHNRIAERLLLGARSHEAAPAPFPLFHQWKLWLDAPLAFLAGYGHYSPDREEQLDRLESLTEVWDTSLRPWIDGGIERARFMLRTMRTRPLDLDDLCGGDTGVEESVQDRKARSSLVQWVWPFHRALLDRGLGASRADAEIRLRGAVLGGPPSGEDVKRGESWLRRRGRLATMREARRWAPLAGFSATAWWRHGRGGCGPDRIHLAAALRFGGLSGWRDPLRGLFPEGAEEMTNGAETEDAWLGRLWSSWIMGGART